METYHVAGNLSHDGKEYRRGDTIHLDEAQAASLLSAGVIQSEAIETPAPVQKPEAPAIPDSTEAVAGGTPMKTGEPSIDGADSERTEDNAIDITIPTEDMHRDELEEIAVAEGMTKEEAKGEQNKGSLIKRILDRRNSAPAASTEEPVIDPSADL